MTHDPFDRLRDANPVPDEALPAAPMDTAARIMHKGSLFGRWPAWAVASSAALAVLLVGGGWMLWLGRGDSQTFAADPTTTSSVAAVVIPAMETTAYLLQETPSGQVVVPVPRLVQTTDPVQAAFDGLLGDLNADETSRDLFTSLPQSDWLSLLEVSNGTAVVRISDAALAARYEALPPGALAQIVFTLTRVDGISGVDFLLGDGDGVPGGVVAGSLQLIPEDEFSDHSFVDVPATRLTFEGYMPLAFIEAPSFGNGIALPFAAEGVANSIGNQVRLTLEVDERTLWQEVVTGTCGTPWSECRGEWDWSIWETIIPDVGYSGGANLIVEAFGSGVEILDRRVYPLLVTSSGQTTATTTTMIEAGPAVPGELAVYMLMDADATHTTAGPHLVPAAWTTAILSAPLTDAPRQAMTWLLQGPLPGWVESNPAISTTIPEETRLLDLIVADGTAIVDLSAEFVSGGGSASMQARLAQVVFTLTRFDHIHNVRFLIDGVPTTVFGGEGVIIGDPSTRDGFGDLLPPILIETPLYWGLENGNPLRVSGTADVFEATVSLALTDNDGLILWEGFATATCGTGCRGDWSVEIPYSVDTDQLGAIITWEASARDGSQTNVREHPVWLISDREARVCSGAEVPADLPVQPDVPKAVSELRESLFHAARTCDWGTLSTLLGPHTNTSFGIVEDPILQWKQDEANGLKPMWWLAATLRLPTVQETLEQVDGAWMWPSAAAYYWENVPEADLQALLAIYNEADLVDFTEFGGFYGHRIGISPDGEWLFYVAGD